MGPSVVTGGRRVQPAMRALGIPGVAAKLAATVASALLVVSCSTTPTPSTAGPKSAGPHPAVSAGSVLSAEALVGLWRVTDAADEPSGSVLRLDGSQQPTPLILIRHCGALSGDWVGSVSGGFLGITFAFPESCLHDVGPGDPTPKWLALARSFTISGAERHLLAANGRILARLLPGGQIPQSTAGIPSALAPTPNLTAEEKRTLQTAAQPLPTNSPPATATALIGRWKPAPARHYSTPQQPYLAFAASGRYTGSDGCNQLGGSWTLGRAGELLTMTGASNGVGCSGVPVDAWLPGSGRASISGTTLTFYASNGHVLGRLTR